MDRGSTPHNPWTRSLSDQVVHASQNNSVPPLPHTLQAPVRQSQSTLAYDPFLPRRNDRKESRQGPVNTCPNPTFSLDKYAADLCRAAPVTASMLSDGSHVPRDARVPPRAGEGNLNEYRPRNTSGELIPLLHLS